MTAESRNENKCDHHWVSKHKPGHIVYWVTQCSICHEIDWNDLDFEIRKWLENLIERALPDVP